MASRKGAKRVSEPKKLTVDFMNFYFVRHGEIESNIRKVYAGWSEEPLTERGARQAEAAGEVLRGKGIDRLYCSPLRRAVQTAEIIGEAIGRVPVKDEHFKEMGLGLWEGLSENEIMERFPKEWRIWNSRPAELRLEGRETLEELQERVLAGVRRLSEKKEFLTQRHKGARSLIDFENGSKSVVVTHVAIIRVMLLYSQGRDLNEYRKVAVENGELFELEV